MSTKAKLKKKAMTKKRTLKGGSQRGGSQKGTIVIDSENDFSFENEEALLNHFVGDIEVFEKEFLAKRPKTDFTDDESEKYFHCLDLLLDDPDEVWEDSKSLTGKKVYHYIREFVIEDNSFFYVAVTHVVDELPTFIYLHFPTKFSKVAERYQRGDLVFDRIAKEVEQGAIEGDSLSEGDELAVGLYKAMLKLRNETDIPEADFAQFSEMREEAIEDADEIWRNQDFNDFVLVNFIRQSHDHEGEEELYYIVVTSEEGSASSHALLFSFPTRDSTLVDRYRHGENLQADEVVQEASH